MNSKPRQRAAAAENGPERERRTDDQRKTQTIAALFRGPEHRVLRTIDELHVRGENLNKFTDRDGNTLLHLAVQSNFLSVAEKVLDYNLKPLVKNLKGEIALKLALDCKSDEMAALIIRKMKPSVVRRLFGDKTPTPRLVKERTHVRGSNVEKKKHNCITCFRRNNAVSPEIQPEASTSDQQPTAYSEDEEDDDDEKEVEPLFSIRKDLIESKNYLFSKTTNALLDCLKEEESIGRYTLYVKLLEDDEKGNEPGTKHFKHKDHTVLQKFAENSLKDHINHAVVRYLIKYKWEKWARKRLIINFVLYLLSLFTLMFGAGNAVVANDLNKFDNATQIARIVCEAIAYLYVCKALFSELSQMRKHRLYYFKQRLNWFELISALLLVAVLPLRWYHSLTHWIVYALGYLLWVLRIFKYAVVFSPTGAYADTLRRIITRDVLQFCLLFGVINLAFGGTFLLVLKGEGSLDAYKETSTIYRIWLLGLRTMIEAGPIVEYTDGYRTSGVIVMLVFMGFTIVILLNILIAQLSETYHSIHTDALKSVYVNRAWIVSRLEQNEHKQRCGKLCTGDRIQKYKSTFINVKLKNYQWKDSTQLDDLKTLILESEYRQMQFNSKMQTMLRACERKLEVLETRSRKMK